MCSAELLLALYVTTHDDTVLDLFLAVSVLWEEMDDEDCERRRGECLDEMLDLEKQFQDLKEK